MSEDAAEPPGPRPRKPHVYIDADACPVKEETYRVAGRNKLQVTLVANSWMNVPREEWIELEVVREGFDAADDWIVDRVVTGDIVITADVPLADRCIKKGARVLGTTGKPFTEDNIGDVLATRDLMTELRTGGVRTSGPAAMTKKDRSLFLQRLEEMVQAARGRGEYWR